MTGYEKLLRDTLGEQMRGMDKREALEHMIRHGLLNRTACERMAVRREVARLEGEGIPRCEAFHVVADTCCCSYEKVRGHFYYPKNQ